jgi:hypothetical protein
VAMTGKLPYNHLVFKGQDTRSALVALSLQILCVVLDFQSGKARDAALESGEFAPTARTNAFRYFVAKLVSFLVRLTEACPARLTAAIAPRAGLFVPLARRRPDAPVRAPYDHR